MIQLALVTCCLLCGAALWLWERLGEGPDIGTWPELDRELRAQLDRDLPPPWETVDVPWREVHDGFRTADELLRRLPDLRAWNDLAGFERLVRALYQLQAALDLPDEGVGRILQPELERLREATFLDRPLGGVEPVARGAPLDRSAMRPLNPGSTVRQPLGLVVRDAEGRVVSRAKVVCA